MLVWVLHGFALARLCWLTGQWTVWGLCMVVLGERQGRGWRAGSEACRLPLAFHVCREGDCSVELFLCAISQGSCHGVHSPLPPQLYWPCTARAGREPTLCVFRKTSSLTQSLCHCTGASVSARGGRQWGWLEPQIMPNGGPAGLCPSLEGSLKDIWLLASFFLPWPSNVQCSVRGLLSSQRPQAH